MTARHVLSDGGEIELRSRDEVSERLRRPIKAKFARLSTNKAFTEVVGKAVAGGGAEALVDMPEAEQVALAAQLADSLDALDDINDLLAVARIASWTYGDEVTVDRLLDLPGPIYDEIRKLVAGGVMDLMPDFSPSQAEDSPIAPSIA